MELGGRSVFPMMWCWLWGVPVCLLGIAVLSESSLCQAGFE